MVFEVDKEELEQWKANGYTGKVFKTRKECEEFERKLKRNRPYKTAQECFEWLKEKRPDLPEEMCSALVCMEYPGEYPTFHLDDKEKKQYFAMLEQKANENSLELTSSLTLNDNADTSADNGSH
jgi:hypothetical protein